VSFTNASRQRVTSPPFPFFHFFFSFFWSLYPSFFIGLLSPTLVSNPFRFPSVLIIALSGWGWSATIPLYGRAVFFFPYGAGGRFFDPASHPLWLSSPRAFLPVGAWLPGPFFFFLLFSSVSYGPLLSQVPPLLRDWLGFEAPTPSFLPLVLNSHVPPSRVVCRRYLFFFQTVLVFFFF